jgi:hypothetical protein
MIVASQPDFIKLIILCLKCEKINSNVAKTHGTEGYKNQQLIFQTSALKLYNRKSLKYLQLSAVQLQISML